MHTSVGYTLNADNVTRTVIFTVKNYWRKFIGKEMDMVVKIQTSLNLLTFDPKPYIRVYSQSRDFDVRIKGYDIDRNCDIINDKIPRILKDGLPCARLHPLLKKLYGIVYLKRFKLYMKKNTLEANNLTDNFLQTIF